MISTECAHEPISTVANRLCVDNDGWKRQSAKASRETFSALRPRSGSFEIIVGACCLPQSCGKNGVWVLYMLGHTGAYRFVFLEKTGPRFPRSQFRSVAVL